MSFDDFRRRARARPSRARVARLPARHRHAGHRLRQAARGPVRLPARERARRGRDLGALHLPRQRAARAPGGCATAWWTTGRRIAGWHGAHAAEHPLDDLDALVRAHPPGGRAGARRASGAAPSASSATTPCASSSACPSPPPRGDATPDALLRVHRRARHHRQPARAGARRRRRAGWTRTPSERGAARGVRRGARRRWSARSRGCAAPRHAARRSTCGRTRRPPRECRRTSASSFLEDVGRIKEYIAAGRRLPGAARAPHPRAARLPLRRALPRAARAQSVAVHVSPRARRPGARRQLARAARARGRAGKVTVRPIAGTRPRGATPEADAALAGGARRRREGARRARDARRPRPQRRGTDRRVRQRGGDRLHDRGALLARACTS